MSGYLQITLWSMTKAQAIGSRWRNSSKFSQRDKLHILNSAQTACIILDRGSYMSAHVLLNLLNWLRKRDKM